MIVIIGDIHGEFELLQRRLKDVPLDALVIQVGDLGYWPELAIRWEQAGIKHHVQFVDGNHDFIPELLKFGSSFVNTSYIERGEVICHDGYRILCVGGSKSLDRAYRTLNGRYNGWYPEEQLSPQEADWAIERGKLGVDLMISHTPPMSVIDRNFSKDTLTWFDLDPETWENESAVQLERVWTAVGKPQLYCGHMHRSVVDGNVRILQIGEMVTLEPKASLGA